MSVAASETVAILLAAGRSRRFGNDNKVQAALGGQPLIARAAAAIAALPFARRLVVAARGMPAPTGFDAVINAQPDQGIGYSIALGVAAAITGGPHAILIALADMPLIPATHFTALLETFGAANGKVATEAPSGRAMVPAVFGAKHFGALARLTGDHGAQVLLADAPLVGLDPMLLLDIDRPEDLAIAAARLT